ncbi:MAG: hypothetical protein ACYDBW_00410 [Sulfuricaulis sp.]
MLRYFLLIGLLLPLAAVAADVSVSGRVTARDGGESVSVVYSNRDRAMIDDYYRQHRETRYEDRRDRNNEYDDEDEGNARGRGHGHGQGKGMPPGLAKRGGDLPPGLAMRRHLPPGLARNDRLPEDVEYETLPRDLERRLPPLPSRDYIRVRVGTDFLILNKKTHVVLDVVQVLGQ